jgi:hypothetical protein
VQSAINKQEVEREELGALLASGVLGRTNNLVRLLSFVCDKYFAGHLDEIKEYNIAVEALGRPPDFDPQVDTIVRVTAHALRKRLEDYYRSAGTHHPVHICLPPGHYVPKFVHKEDLEAVSHPEPIERKSFESLNNDNDNALPEENPLAPALTAALRVPVIADAPPSLAETSTPKAHRPFAFPARILAAASIVLLVALIYLGFTWYKGSRASARERSSVVATGISGQGLRAMAGENRDLYVDHTGASWESDRFCSGGSSFSVGAGRTIQGTEDPQLFSAGRRGNFHCTYPVPPGTYEVHLMFAETAGLLENGRNMAFSLNGNAVTNFDVVDDAGGDDIATTKVFTDVKPEADGAIHLDFDTPNSFLNAVEILPGIPRRMLPVRIVTGPSIYRDSQGNTWLPDRYYFGGRVNRFASDLSKLPDGRLFEWHRYGHFHYSVPVAPGNKYTLKLYFLEHWFGAQNGSVGGAGSRVFDVSCNGVMLLKGFDIFREAGAEPLVKTFNHIEPTGQGKMEIYFTPAVNYPSVSGIEIIPE